MVDQILIAIDQLFNTMAGGWADETISARSYRMKDRKAAWRILHNIIDLLFFWQENHCLKAYKNEFSRKHLPSSYHIKEMQENGGGDYDK